jgi:hypothetical protein
MVVGRRSRAVHALRPIPPWFKEALLRRILNVEEPTPGHFYWPELDIELSEDIIAHPNIRLEATMVHDKDNGRGNG